MLPYTFTRYQSAFVEGSQVLYVSLIVDKLIEDWTRRKLNGVVIKLDVDKAFDKVDEYFTDEILKVKGFGTEWRNWVRGCISSSNFSIINGKSKGKTFAARDLRQGDPYLLSSLF